MAVRLARYLQRSFCSDAARKPCSAQISGGGGLLLVPEVERLIFVSMIKRFKDKNESMQKQYFGSPTGEETDNWWDAKGLTGEDDDGKLQAGAEIAFRQIAKLAEDEATDWKEQLFIGPDLRTRIADQCADWRAAGYKPVIDIQEITCEVLAPLPGPVSKPGYGPTSGPSALWFSLLWIANCVGLADHSIALNVPILITAKGGSLKLVKIDAEPVAATDADAGPVAAAEADTEPVAVGETDAEPVAAAEASNVSSEESSIEGMDSQGTSSVVSKASKRKEDVARLNALLGAEPDESQNALLERMLDKLHEDIELTDDLPVGDAMEASLGNNVWIFSCVPRKVITMSSEDYEWKLTDINGAVNTM